MPSATRTTAVPPAASAPALPDPLALGPADLARLDATARHERTPCGDGHMAWRSWGTGKDVLLLLHGGGGSWAHWVRNIDAFSARYTVWAPDFPGMGDSALPPDPWTPQSVADITEAGLRYLLGDQACLVLGFSFGGMIGGHLAARHPARVRRLVLVAAAGTGLSTDPGHRMQSWRRVEDPAQRRAIHRHNLGTWMLPDPRRVDDLATEVAFRAVEADRLRNREVSRTDTLLQALPLVTCPVDGIWGGEDAMFSAVRQPLEAALRAAGVASLHWIEGAGHWVPYDSPRELSETVESLLAPACTP